MNDRTAREKKRSEAYSSTSLGGMPPCPFAPLDLLQWRHKGKTYFYRFLHHCDLGYYVIPMGEKPTRPDRQTKIVLLSYNKIAIHLGASLAKIENFVVRDYMKSDYDSKLTFEQKRARELRKWLVMPVLDGSLSSELNPSRNFFDIIDDPKWRQSLFVARAKQVAINESQRNLYFLEGSCPSLDALVDRIKNAFFSWYYFSVEDAGLIPGYQDRGGVNSPKSITNRKKPGPKKEILCGNRIIEAEEQGSWCDAEWRVLFKVGIDRYGRGKPRLGDSELYKAITDDAQLRRLLPQRKVRSGEKPPRLEIFTYHRPILEKELGITWPERQVSPAVGARGGNSTDIAYGREQCDVDACVFEMVEIFYGDPKNPVLATRSPTVSFAVLRKGKAILGWYTTYGGESNELYRFLMLNCFCKKDERLDELGYTGNRDGFIWGPIHSIVADDGPCLKKKFPEKLILGMGLDVDRTPIATPEAKGDVEGVNSVLKRIFRLVLRKLIRKFPSLIHWRHAPYRMPTDRDVKVRMYAKDFDLLVAKAVNAFNCQPVKAVDVGAEYITGDYVGFTRASLYNERKANRPISASMPMDSRPVHLRFLQREHAVSIKGKVTTKYGQYHSDELAFFEAAYRRTHNIKNTEGVPIEIVTPPYGNTVKWIVADNDIRILEPTAITRACHQRFTDLEERRLRLRIERTKARRQRGRVVGAMLAATEDALRNTAERFGEALKGEIPYDANATKALKSERRRREFDATAKAVGMDTSVEQAQEEEGKEKVRSVAKRMSREDAAWFRTHFSDEDAERD